MQTYATVTFAITCVLGLGVALRLLVAWQRTRQVPELALGIASAAMTLSAIGLVAAEQLAATAPDTARMLWLVGVLLFPVNPIALGVGVWRIFRPESRWAPVLCGGFAIGLATWTFLRLSAGEVALQTSDPRAATLAHGIRFAVYAWAGIECFRYRSLLQRRDALGLGNPGVAHQIGLWGLSTFAVAALTAIGYYGFLVVGKPLLEWPAGLLVVNGLGVAGAASIWLAFFPPAVYRRGFLESSQA